MTKEERSSESASLTVYGGERIELIDLATAGRLTGLHGELIVEFARARLVPLSPSTADPGEPLFDERGLCRLRQIAELHVRQKVPLRTIRLIARLLDRIERTEEELRELRERGR